MPRRQEQIQSDRQPDHGGGSVRPEPPERPHPAAHPRRGRRVHPLAEPAAVDVVGVLVAEDVDELAQAKREVAGDPRLRAQDPRHADPVATGEQRDLVGLRPCRRLVDDDQLDALGQQGVHDGRVVLTEEADVAGDEEHPARTGRHDDSASFESNDPSLAEKRVAAPAGRHLEPFGRGRRPLAEQPLPLGLGGAVAPGEHLGDRRVDLLRRALPAQEGPIAATVPVVLRELLADGQRPPRGTLDDGRRQQEAVCPGRVRLERIDGVDPQPTRRPRAGRARPPRRPPPPPPRPGARRRARAAGSCRPGSSGRRRPGDRRRASPGRRPERRCTRRRGAARSRPGSGRSTSRRASRRRRPRPPGRGGRASARTRGCRRCGRRRRPRALAAAQRRGRRRRARAGSAPRTAGGRRAPASGTAPPDAAASP